MNLTRTSAASRWLPSMAVLAALLAVLPCQAQYKVIGPDGKVTYTDRPPASSEGKVAPMTTRNGSGPTIDTTLPLELRQVATRYPVTLYTMTGACEPCTSSRQMLRQRGIPFAEKQVLSPTDGDALERLAGGRDVPVLTVGSQVLRGYSPETWNSYLDAAGYPRDSKLPASYQYAAPVPITERVTPVAAAPSAAAPTPAATPAPTPANPTGIKF